MSRRQAQIESTMRRALTQVLSRKVSDPRIRGLVSVTRIELAPDFKTAIVYISVIPNEYLKRAVHGLNSGAGMFQSHLAKVMAIKAIPKLEFRIDDEWNKEAGILDDIQRGLDREGLSVADVPHVGERGEDGEEITPDDVVESGDIARDPTIDETPDKDQLKNTDDVSSKTTENQSR